MCSKLPKDEYERAVIDTLQEYSRSYIPMDRGHQSGHMREITISATTNWIYLTALLSQNKFQDYYTLCMEFVVVCFTIACN